MKIWNITRIVVLIFYIPTFGSFTTQLNKKRRQAQLSLSNTFYLFLLESIFLLRIIQLHLLFLQYQNALIVSTYCLDAKVYKDNIDCMTAVHP